VPPSEIDAILERLPSCQRDLARRKITSAIAFGWTEIRLDPPQSATPHHYDLLGVAPVSRQITILPEVDDVKE